MQEFKINAQKIISETEYECDRFYQTRHVIDGVPQFTENINGEKKKQKLEKLIMLFGPNFLFVLYAMEIFLFGRIVLIEMKSKVKTDFECPHCKGRKYQKKNVNDQWKQFLMYQENNKTNKKERQYE